MAINPGSFLLIDGKIAHGTLVLRSLKGISLHRFLALAISLLLLTCDTFAVPPRQVPGFDEDANQQSRKRSRDKDTDLQNISLPKRANNTTGTTTISAPYVPRELLSSGIHVISGPEAHRRHLLESLRAAKKSILIASFGFHINRQEDPDLFGVLDGINWRRVAMNIYFNHFDSNRDAQDATIGDLEDYPNLRYANLHTHSKALIIDRGTSNEAIYIGSCNWLARDGYTLENVSLRISGANAGPLIEHYDDYLRKYLVMSNQDGSDYGKKHDMFAHLFATNRRYERKPIAYKNARQQNNVISLLATPNQHGDVMMGGFQTAQKHIEIHSPFVTTRIREEQRGRKIIQHNPLVDHLPRGKIETLLRSGRKIAVQHAGRRQETTIMEEHLGDSQRRFGNITFMTDRKMHQKIFVVSNGAGGQDTITIGSFNFFSADLEINEEGNDQFTAPLQYNTSLHIEGPDATEIINELRNRGILKL